MATQLDVANSALSKIGEASILSLDDDTKAARLCKLRLDPIRKIVLRLHPWNSARSRVVLAPLVETPAFGWTAAFQLPTDYLRLVMIEPDDVEYIIEGRKILANESEIDLRYVRDETDFTQLDELLAEAIACYLAWDIGYPICQSNTVVDRCWKQFEAIKRQAKTVGSQESRGDTLTAESIVESRIQGTGGLRNPSS